MERSKLRQRRLDKRNSEYGMSLKMTIAALVGMSLLWLVVFYVLFNTPLPQ